MKFEKKYSRIELKDFFMLFLFMISLYILSLILGMIISGGKAPPFKETAIIWGLFPLLLTWTGTAFNRNGIMTISNYDKMAPVIRSIETAAIKLDYLVIQNTGPTIHFDKKTKWGRFFNIFLRENLEVTIEDDKIMIHGKKKIITLLENKIKRDFLLKRAFDKNSSRKN
jgi:hypothetical protein